LVVIKLRLPSCGSQARVSKCGYAVHAGSAERGDLDTALEAEFDRKLRRARDRVRRGIRSAPFRPWGLLKAIANGQAGEIEGCQIWLRFATWILLALEFAPAADIFAHRSRPPLGTIFPSSRSSPPSVNYFLAKDISAFDQYNNQAPRGES